MSEREERHEVDAWPAVGRWDATGPEADAPWPFLLLAPVRGDDGAVVDFRVVRTNAAAHEAVAARGGEPLHAWIPDARGTGLFDGLVRVIERGARHEQDVVFGRGEARLVARVWEGFVTLWLREAPVPARGDSDGRVLDLLFEAAPVALAAFDPLRRCVRQNLHFQRVAAHAALCDGNWARVLVDRTFEDGLGIEGDAITVGEGEALRMWVPTTHPVHDATGATTGVVLSLVDVTDRRRTEERLQRAADLRDRLLGIVSHDLRNPLNAITLSAQRLLRLPVLPEPARKAAQRIVSSADRMHRLIAELLDSTRGRLQGGIPVEPRTCDFFAVATETLEELAASHPGRSLVVTREGDGRGHWDGERLAQVLANLVCNGFNHGGTGEVSVALDGSAREELVLQVRNSGPQIPPEVLPAIFEPFSQGGATAGHRGGLGLGLYIVRHIVAAHGGRIDVESVPGRTVFTVRLPRLAG